MPEPELDERDRAILAFEERWRPDQGGKEAAIRATFGISAARYYQLLNVVIQKPAALRVQPLLVKRLLNTRESRLQKRAARRA